MRKPRRRAFSPLPRPSLCILADFFRSNSRVGYDSGRRSRWGERLREGAAAREREEAIDVIGASDSRHSFFARRAHEIVIIPCAFTHPQHTQPSSPDLPPNLTLPRLLPWRSEEATAAAAAEGATALLLEEMYTTVCGSWLAAAAARSSDLRRAKIRCHWRFVAPRVAAL